MRNLHFSTPQQKLEHRPDRKQNLIGLVWGEGPSKRYEELANNFRSVFAKIQKEALSRELNHILPVEQIQWLKDTGFTKLRLPKVNGGFDATIPELFALLIELAQADSNLPQILRIHFGFTEDVLLSKNTEFQQLWLKRIGAGQTIGSAWSEGGKEGREQFQTNLHKATDGTIHLTGKKYYTTGSLYADWIDVGVTDLNGESGSVLIKKNSKGVNILDDWNGFGQQLTASGTAVFDNVIVNEEDILSEDIRFKYSSGYYQLVQLAIITGLGRALNYDLAAAVKQRTRNYSHANTNLIQQDPQILQIVGKIRAAVYSASAIIEKSAKSLQRAYLSAFQQNLEIEENQNALAELETAQAQTVILDLMLDASTNLFDALGASATDKALGFDRYWRNVRTLASHNPRIFKDRIIGDFSVNGTLPSFQWRVGNTPTPVFDQQQLSK